LHGLALLVIIDTPSFMLVVAFIDLIHSVLLKIQLVESYRLHIVQEYLHRLMWNLRHDQLPCTGQAFVWRRVHRPRMEKSHMFTTRCLDHLFLDVLFWRPSICKVLISSMARSSSTFSRSLRLLITFYAALAVAVSTQEPLLEKSSYKLGDAIPVTCLNRTV